jgi:citrate lyase subunit beta/citryl-CoA lyase
MVRDFLMSTRGTPEFEFWVRINTLSSSFALSDLCAVLAGGPDGTAPPKTTSADDAARLSTMLDVLEARAELRAGSVKILPVARKPPRHFSILAAMQEQGSTAALTWGRRYCGGIGALSNRRDDGVDDDLYRLARMLCLVGAKAAGVEAIDTIWADFRDEAGLSEDARKARRAGFVGKIAIHPAQVPVIHAAFQPSEAEIAEARRIVSAFDAHSGLGTVGLDGRMLDMPHLKHARNILATARSLFSRDWCRRQLRHSHP